MSISAKVTHTCKNNDRFTGIVNFIKHDRYMFWIVLIEPQSFSMARVIRAISKKELELNIWIPLVAFSDDFIIVSAYFIFSIIAGTEPVL